MRIKKDMRINSNTKDKRKKTRQGFEDKKNIKDMRKKKHQGYEEKRRRSASYYFPAADCLILQ